METINNANDLIAQLTGTLKSRDDMRLEYLQRAALLGALEKSSVQKEQVRLAKKYGVNSVQASAATDRLTLISQEHEALAADIARTSIPVPAIESGKFIVYGRIINADGKGVSGAKVTATDAKGSALASGSSKSQGMFEVHVPLSTKKQAAGKGEDAAKKESEAAASAPPPPLSFRLVITGSKLEQPYTSPETIAATAGRLAFREITLPGSIGSNESQPTQTPKKKTG